MNFENSRSYSDGYIDGLRGRSFRDSKDKYYLAGYYKGQIQLNPDAENDLVFCGSPEYVTKKEFIELVR